MTDLTNQERAALAHLKRRPGSSRDEIAQAIGCRRDGNTHRIIAGLIAKGLVRNTRRERGLEIVK